jgi:predicted Ser/Thr protein kinase
MDGCPDTNAFAALTAGVAGEAEQVRLEAHLDGCPACADALAMTARAAPASTGEPVRVGRYELLGEIGRGGMGVVYEALDPTLERRVAVKLLREGLPEQAGLRLVSEAKALGRLAHANVIRVLDAGMHDGGYYVAMERVVGEPLRHWLRAGPRSADDVLTLFEKLAEGLEAVHQAGLVHRDVKPDNIVVDAAGNPTLIDFGLALDARAVLDPAVREVAGTLPYMAPEQTRGESLGPTADQYAFCLTLRDAFTALHEVSGKDQRPPWLSHVLERGLAPEPRRRWPSMQLVVDELRLGRSGLLDQQRRLNAVFQLMLWPFHVALNALMLFVLASPKDAPPVESGPATEFLAGAMATWLIGAFLTGWAPLGLVWTPLNAWALWRRRAWAYRSTVIYSLFTMPSILGTPFALYALVTLWRRAFPKKR